MATNDTAQSAPVATSASSSSPSPGLAVPNLKVLSLNVWGLAFFSKKRNVRIPAIAQQLAASDYDIVALQELWCESTDWRDLRSRCSGRFPYSKFFYGGAFGSGLAILSRYPIVATQTNPYSLNGHPVFVHHGDWIAAKAAGAVTLSIPQIGLVDVWNTHTVAAGGEDGPEARRAHRVSQAYELATLARQSAKKGHHVICCGDFNSTPPSLAIAVLQDVAGLKDAYCAANPARMAHATSLPSQRSMRRPDPRRCIQELGVTCDSPINTWTAGKKLDERALKGAGKRLDYIFFRGPAEGKAATGKEDKVKLQCTQSRVCFTELVPGHEVSYSDHFGLEATFDLVAAGGEASALEARPAQEDGDFSYSPKMAQTLTASLSAFASGLLIARRSQHVHFLGFIAAVVLAVFSIILSASQTFGQGGFAAIWTFLAVVCGWAGTTLLYSAVVWGEWEKRTYRTFLEAMELELNVYRAQEEEWSASRQSPKASSKKMSDFSTAAPTTNGSAEASRNGAANEESLVNIDPEDGESGAGASAIKAGKGVASSDSNLI